MSKHIWSLAEYVNSYKNKTLFETATQGEDSDHYSLWLCHCGAYKRFDYNHCQTYIDEPTGCPHESEIG